MGQVTAVVTQRRHKGFDGRVWGFDCDQGFAPLGCEVGCRDAAERSAHLYNTYVERDWTFWPFEQTVFIQ